MFDPFGREQVAFEFERPNDQEMKVPVLVQKSAQRVFDHRKIMVVAAGAGKIAHDSPGPDAPGPLPPVLTPTGGKAIGNNLDLGMGQKGPRPVRQGLCRYGDVVKGFKGLEGLGVLS